MNTIIYNGKSLGEFNSYFDGSTTFGSPEKDYEIISIPGRDGDLSIFNRFSDIDVSIPCYIRHNFIENYRNLLQYLNGANGYQRFEISNDPDHFRKALFLGAVEPNPGQFNRTGKFNLRFRLNPQRWLKWAEEWIDATSEGTYTWTIENPTNMQAKPMLQFRGNGTITFYGSGQTANASITVTNNAYSYVEIDCETFDCYSESLGLITNRNADVSFNGDPEMVTGENNIVYSTSYTGMEPVIQVMPRFFEI